MRLKITRGCKDEKFHEFTGDLYLSANGRFNFYFDKETVEGIGLNDGQFHQLRELKGVATSVIIDKDVVCLEGCFVDIDGKWHKDGFSFYAIQ